MEKHMQKNKPEDGLIAFGKWFQKTTIPHPQKHNQKNLMKLVVKFGI